MARRRVQGRAATLVGLVVLGGLLLAASGCVPGLRASLGLPASYSFTTLRSGTIYTEARPGVFLWGSPKYQSSLVFASAGEAVVVRSDAEVEQGRIVLGVVAGPWGADDLASEHITASGRSELRVVVPATGVYRVTATYVFEFRGSDRVDWHVE